MLSRILYLFSGALGIGFLFWGYWEEIAIYSYIGAAFVLIATIFYIFAPQINFFFTKRQRIEIGMIERQMLHKMSALYTILDNEDQRVFNYRMNLIMQTKKFVARDEKEILEDSKIALCHSIIALTLYDNNYLFEKYEQVVLYRHPFPSPQFETLHLVEHQEEDGAIVLSEPHLINGFLNPRRYFDIGSYVFALIWLEFHRDRFNTLLLTEVETDAILRQILNTDYETVMKYIGLPRLDALAVILVLFIRFPKELFAFQPLLFHDLIAVIGYEKYLGNANNLNISQSNLN